MNKCFEGINKVQFDKNNDIIQGMMSTEGEKVPMIKFVNVNEGENKGNVEKWLLQVEGKFVISLHHSLK